MKKSPTPKSTNTPTPTRHISVGPDLSHAITSVAPGQAHLMDPRPSHIVQPRVALVQFFPLLVHNHHE